MATEMEIAKRLFGWKEEIEKAFSKSSGASVRYGTVTAINDDGTIDVQLDDTGEVVRLRTTTPVKIGSKVTVVVSNGTYLVHCTDVIVEQITEQGQEILDFVDALGDLGDQIDGKVDVHYYAYTPTTSNLPASGWTDEDKIAHTGDLFYNTSNGYCYRWTGSAWSQITDDRITDALETAQNAETAADGKAQIFTSTPKPPYQVGDLWVQGSGGDIKYCVRSRSSGSYVSSDWSLASGYTDDARVEEVVESFSMARTVATVTKTLEGSVSPPSSPTVGTTYWWVFEPTDAKYAPTIAFATIPLDNVYTSRPIGASGRYISNYVFKIKWPSALGSMDYNNLPICFVSCSGSSEWCDAIVYNRDTSYLGPIAVARDYNGATCTARLEIMVVTRR